MKKITILTAIFSTLLIASIGTEIETTNSPQKTLVVGSKNYQTIGSAIKAADYGDRIIVQSGNYVENLVLKPGLFFDFQKGSVLEGNITDAGYNVDCSIDGDLSITNKNVRNAAIFLINPYSKLYIKANIYSKGIGIWNRNGEVEILECNILAEDYAILSGGRAVIRESNFTSLNNSAIHIGGGEIQALNCNFISYSYYAGEQSGGAPLFVDCTFYALSTNSLYGAGFNTYYGEELVFSSCIISAGPNSLSIDNENAPRFKSVKTILPSYVSAPINSNITTTGEFIIYEK